MSTKPEIILSALDLERLERLLEKTQFPGKAALEAELGRARVVAPQNMPDNVVTMNSTVRFSESPGKSEFCLTLVYPKDAGQEGTISILAPVGGALLGLHTGAEIEWPGPTGNTLHVRIEEIVYQPERAGEFHR